MAYIRRKVHKGKTYLYEVECYRDSQTGKVKQRIKQYLGRDPKEKEPAEKLGTTTESKAPPLPPPSIGDAVTVQLTIGGEEREILGTLTHGTTQVEACTYPREGRVKYEIHRAIHDPPGAVSVKYEWAGETLVSTVPRWRVKPCPT